MVASAHPQSNFGKTQMEEQNVNSSSLFSLRKKIVAIDVYLFVTSELWGSSFQRVTYHKKG